MGKARQFSLLREIDNAFHYLTFTPSLMDNGPPAYVIGSPARIRELFPLVASMFGGKGTTQDDLIGMALDCLRG